MLSLVTFKSNRPKNCSPGCRGQDLSLENITKWTVRCSEAQSGPGWSRMPSPLGPANSKSAHLWEWCSVGNLVLWPPISPHPIGEKEEIFHICQAFHLHGYKKKKKEWTKSGQSSSWGAAWRHCKESDWVCETCEKTPITC